MDKIQFLLQEANEFLPMAEEIQDEAKTEKARIEILSVLEENYHTWYRSALNLLNDLQQEGKRQLFEQEYTGSFWNAKIIKFLTSALELNPLYIPNNPLVEKWTYPFKRCFKEPLMRQCNILAELETLYQKKTSSSNRKPSTSLGQDTGEEETWADIIQKILQKIGSKAVETEDNPWNIIIRQLSAIFIDAENAKDELWNASIRRIFKVFIEKAESAETAHEKKLTYEYLAIFLIGAINGLSIAYHDSRGASEEIDLIISNESKDSFWQRMKHTFIIECKNWAVPVGASQIRDLIGKMKNKNVDFAIIISKNGITGDDYHDAALEIRSALKEGKYIVLLEHTDLLEVASGMHPTTKIRQKYMNLLRDNSSAK